MYLMLLAGLHGTAALKYITLMYLGISLVTVLTKIFQNSFKLIKKIVRTVTFH